VSKTQTFKETKEDPALATVLILTLIYGSLHPIQ